MEASLLRHGSDVDRARNRFMGSHDILRSMGRSPSSPAPAVIRELRYRDDVAAT